MMNKQARNRVAHIAKVLADEGMGYLIDRLELRHHLPWKHRVTQPRFHKVATKPERVRQIMERLGASYIKLGQLLSVRPDLVPQRFANEFTKLQDEVPQMPFSTVKQVVEDELKKPLYSVFKSFDKKPIGSASVSQVHKATLKNGEHVVVKVQRPTIAQRFAEDIEVMRFFAHKLEKHNNLDFSPTEIVDEFEFYTKQELDFMLEADHIKKFEKQFTHSKQVKIPHCYQDFSTHNVLVMEQIHGQKLSSIIRRKKKHIPNTITQNILELSLKQFFRMDLFHADLHPGNIMVMRDGKIALLDFGITGSMTPFVREQAIKMYLALIDKDAQAAEEALMDLGDVAKLPASFKREVQKIINEWHSGSTRGQRVTHQLRKLLSVCTENGIQLPTDMILLGKGLVTLEATCLQVDKEFDFVESSKPYMLEVLESSFRSNASLKTILKRSMTIKEFAERFPRQLLNTMHSLEDGSFKIDIEDEDIKKIGSRVLLSSDRLSLAMLSGAFVVSGGLVLQVNLAPHVFGYSVLAMVSFLLAFTLASYLIADIVHQKA